MAKCGNKAVWIGKISSSMQSHVLLKTVEKKCELRWSKNLLGNESKSAGRHVGSWSDYVGLHIYLILFYSWNQINVDLDEIKVNCNESCTDLGFTMQLISTQCYTRNDIVLNEIR